MAEKKPSKEQLAEQVERLEKRLREARQAPEKTPVKEAGSAESLLASLGKMVPGLQKLIDMASQMPEFHERLASIDEEIKRKFKEQPLRQASLGIAHGLGHRQMGIPPSVRRGRTTQGTSIGAGGTRSAASASKRGGYHKSGSPKLRITPESPAQLAVDVFDEGDRLVILAEAPGLMLEHIDVSLEDTLLLIRVSAPGRAGIQRVELPCEVVGQPEVSIAKGILKIHISKADSL